MGGCECGPMILTGDNGFTRRITFDSATLSTTTLTETDLGSKLKLRGERLVTKGLAMARSLQTNSVRTAQ